MNINKVGNDTTKSTAHIRSILQFVNSIETQDDNDFLFPWYTIPRLSRFFDPNSSTTAERLIDFISSHYENVSGHFGYKVLPPELFINSIGHKFMDKSMLEKASAVFELNIQNYPKSSNVYDSRGDCFLAQQDSIKALEYFTKALEVGSNDFSQEKTDMLKEKLTE